MLFKKNIKDKELEMYLKMLKEYKIKIITASGKAEKEKTKEKDNEGNRFIK